MGNVCPLLRRFMVSTWFTGFTSCVEQQSLISLRRKSTTQIVASLACYSHLHPTTKRHNTSKRCAPPARKQRSTPDPAMKRCKQKLEGATLIFPMEKKNRLPKWVSSFNYPPCLQIPKHCEGRNNKKSFRTHNEEYVAPGLMHALAPRCHSFPGCDSNQLK